MDLLSLGLLVAVYAAVIVRQLTARGPSVWLSFAIGGFATVAVGILPLSGAEGAIAEAAPVLVFLFALFLFAADLERAGAIDHVARWLVGRAGRAETLPFYLFVGFGLLSAFLVNDALALLGVPLLLVIARRLEMDAKPLLLTLAYAVTVGSVLTPMGNPQNLLVSLSSGVAAPVAVFLRYLLVPTLVNLALGGWYLTRVFGPRLAPHARAFTELRSQAPRLFPEGGWRRRLIEYPSLWLFPVTMTVIVTVSVTSVLVGGPSVPVEAMAFGGAVVLLAASPQRSAVLARVDWSILLLFAGLFVVVNGAIAGGVLGALEGLYPIPGPGAGGIGLLAITGTSLGGPQLVSNVPWVALQIPVLHALGYTGATPVAWVALAAASTLAGNLTLLGAASNLIIVERAERDRLRIGLGEFVRHGLPLTAITVSVLVGLLWIGL